MRLMKLKEVIECTGLSRASIYKYMGNNAFPRSVSLGDRAVAWVEEEVQEWILAKIAQRDQNLG